MGHKACSVLTMIVVEELPTLVPVLSLYETFTVAKRLLPRTEFPANVPCALIFSSIVTGRTQLTSCPAWMVCRPFEKSPSSSISFVRVTATIINGA